MSPCIKAAGTTEEAIKIISISNPLALKTPHSFAANSGKAVIVKAALEILVFPRRSCPLAPSGTLKSSSMTAAPNIE